MKRPTVRAVAILVAASLVAGVIVGAIAVIALKSMGSSDADVATV